MSLELDHILWAAPDLESAVADLAAVTGIMSGVGGSHPGFGTRNQLLSLGEQLFFEIIAPDPAQSETGRRADQIAGMAAPRLHAFCLQSHDLTAAAAAADAAGIATEGPVSMSRTRPDGVTLNWSILYLVSEAWGEALPFLIDWKGSQHPGGTAPGGCELIDFAVLHPRAAELEDLYARLDVPVPVKRAPAPGFLARLATPNGPVVLT